VKLLQKTGYTSASLDEAIIEETSLMPHHRTNGTDSDDGCALQSVGEVYYWQENILGED